MTAADDTDEHRPQPPFAYVERRSYRELLWVVAALALGFVLDISLGGAAAHVVGWLVAAVVLCGTFAVIIASARATRSLVVTDGEVWVGEEAVRRDEITAVTPGIDRDLPVLGWPTGRSGRFGGLTLHLERGVDVVVPAKRPARLAAVLGVAGPAPATTVVREATEDDLARLPDIDDRAEVVFRVAGYALPELPWSLPDERIAVFVAGDPPVGFALLTEVDGQAHLEEIAVLPGSMRTGVGGRLLDHACRWAADAGYTSMTLCTYADVPWNGPWYASRGFARTSDYSDGVRALREHEAEVGLDAVGERIVMRRALAP
ncbi:GNAT family N-acetyltransferase [Jatrophihabitans fulvus]